MKTKLRILSISTLFLAVFNLILLWVVQTRPPHPKREGPKFLIMERLHFSKDQREQYELLIAKHRQNVHLQETQLLACKQTLYVGLRLENNPQKDSLMQEVSKAYMHLEKTHLSHFEEIKSLCTPQQKAYFNDLTQDLAQLFLPSPQKPPHR